MAAKANIKGLIRGLKGADAKVRAAAQRAVTLAAMKIEADAKVLCPKDTGALAASGTTQPAAWVSSSRIEAVVGFNTDYAAAVHENVGANFNNGQAKFLETAIKANRSRFESYVAGEVKAALDSAGGGT